MKRLARVLMAGMFLAGSLRCEAEAACTELVVQGRVEAAKGELTLADLLTPGSCMQLQQAAAQVSLGSMPRAGRVRVFDGREVRGLLAGFAEGIMDPRKSLDMKIPERIVVQRAATMMSCREIARFIGGGAPPQDMAGPPRGWENELNCAAARDIPEGTALELTKSVWNAPLRRWEFTLRCSRPEDCVPFLIWASEQKTLPFTVADTQNGDSRYLSLMKESPLGLEHARKAEGGAERLVKPGHTATLTWEQAGIRVVLPVTCLDAGGLGQLVRVRFKNTPGILRAEVVGAGMLRASQ
jgi:Chaperone for flagella basal body P-ring formation